MFRVILKNLLHHSHRHSWFSMLSIDQSARRFSSNEWWNCQRSLAWAVLLAPHPLRMRCLQLVACRSCGAALRKLLMRPQIVRRSSCPHHRCGVLLLITSYQLLMAIHFKSISQLHLLGYDCYVRFLVRLARR